MQAFIQDNRFRMGLAFLLVLAVVGLGVHIRWREQGKAAEGAAAAVGQVVWDDVWLLSRMVAAEATGEPFNGQVAVAAVIINRVNNPRFPGTLSEVLFEPWAFEPVMNGRFWSVPVEDEHLRAAEMALNGYDPSYGSLYFWNPGTSSSPWIWTRRIVVSIGEHVFGL
jgi:N-acetylmuramoyl-L-alanine amidase